MATEAQIAASRRNAQRSTGPRTVEGKARSCRNALKHGLASISQSAFLSVEEKSAFDRTLESYIRTYQPQHADEVHLITSAVFCQWRQQRIWNVEATAIEMTIAEQQHDLQRRLPKANAAAHVANATRLNAEADRLNRRYEAQLHRQYVRNLKLVRELQAERIDWEPTLEDVLQPEPPEARQHPGRNDGEATPNPAPKPGERPPAPPITKPGGQGGDVPPDRERKDPPDAPPKTPRAA